MTTVPTRPAGVAEDVAGAVPTEATAFDGPGHHGGPDGAGAAGGPDGAGGTRERILDIALELFTVQGYEKTSLRQIAEQLGFSKAAIYYHFASKGEILMALHLRLHAVGLSALSSMGDSEWTLEAWGSLMDRLVDQILEHRALVILHERNRAALEELHRERHDAEHNDLNDRLQEVLSNSHIEPRDRVRMASALGAVMGSLVFTGNAFSDIAPAELGSLLRDAVGDLLTRRLSASDVATHQLGPDGCQISA